MFIVGKSFFSEILSKLNIKSIAPYHIITGWLIVSGRSCLILTILNLIALCACNPVLFHMVLHVFKTGEKVQRAGIVNAEFYFLLQFSV